MASPSSPSPLFSVLFLLANSNLFPFFFALSIGIPSALLYCLELVVIITNFPNSIPLFSFSSLFAPFRVWPILFFIFW
ncbi:hypothetical protein niasHT_039842 [Heterodera trifolii]|uniref:Uncharacterized protein n=1 Tax=Heterodera trifolii TaxID=157864 RepID=A0ABD2IU79_9BILA